MITMQEPFAQARETQIRHHLSQRQIIEPRPPTLRVRIGRGLIDAGRLLVGDREPEFPRAA
ncbi:MAG: hypothetical protein WAM81_01555 [Acidimicrobiia bacterium]